MYIISSLKNPRKPYHQTNGHLSFIMKYSNSILFFTFLLQDKNLSKIPSLDYSNDEELNEDTRLMYEKYKEKMDNSMYM
jgi:hypothetical protein